MEPTYLKTEEEKLRSLLSDEAKMMPMLDNIQSTVRQMKAKQAFRIALLNQLIDNLNEKE